MSKKIAILTLIILVTIAVGYYVLNMETDTDTGEETDNAAMMVLKELETTTGIDFTDILEAEFVWLVGTDSGVGNTIASGSSFRAIGITENQLQDIMMYFEDSEFEKNIFNNASTSSGTLTGYEKDSIVCSIIHVSLGDGVISDTSTSTADASIVAEIKCGKRQGQLTIDEIVNIVGESECLEKGTLKDNYSYNENSNTWWIDLEVVEEFKQEGCNPACVIDETTKKAEINWRCSGAMVPESDKEDDAIACTADQRGEDIACVAQYEPVCALTDVECVTEPCDPVMETFGNSCEACRESRVSSYVMGECK